MWKIKNNKKSKKNYKKNGSYDIVHIHGIHSNVVNLFIAKICGINKRIYHVHNSSDTLISNNFIGSFFHKMSQLLIKLFATHYLACGMKAAEYIYTKRMIKKKKVIIINNGIDLNEFNIKKKQNTNEIIVGNAARFTDVKRQSFLIKMIAELVKYKKIKLYLAGDGELRKEC